MLKRHEIEILLKAGHPKTEVARLAGVSARSVHRIAEESPVVHVNDSAERTQRHIGRPSIVEDFRKFALEILNERADLPSREILRRVRAAGYRGGKTALYGLVASLRLWSVSKDCLENSASTILGSTPWSSSTDPPVASISLPRA